jgi:hypothetical protein
VNFESYYNDGPVRHIVRDRVVSEEKTEKMAFGNKPKTDIERILKALADKPIDSKPVRTTLYLN